METVTKLQSIFSVVKPIIGMVHVRPLPGSALYNPSVLGMKEIIAIARKEAQILQDAGVDGVQVENIWDYPYVKTGHIAMENLASLAVVVNEVSSTLSIPVGVNVHMNGGVEALACAVAGQARWIRVFEWCNAYISQVGFVDSVGAQVAIMRNHLQANDIVTLCDVNVKHGSHFLIHDRSIEEQAKDIQQQGGDVLVVTGFETGIAPTPEKVELIQKAVSLPVILGSGVTTENAGELLRVADGAIVGSYFKRDNNWKNEVVYDRTKQFMDEVIKVRSTIV